MIFRGARCVHQTLYIKPFEVFPDLSPVHLCGLSAKVSLDDDWKTEEGSAG